MTSLDGPSGTGTKHKRKVVGVVLLGGEELIVHVDVKGRFYEVFNQVTAHLSLRETEYFGLALLKGGISDEEYHFLVLDEKISKIAPKKWKTSPGEGWDSDGSTPLFTVWFRVQFYVDQVVLLREKVTRHLYYQQLRENVLKYDHLYNEEKCFQIVGFALQADFGNFLADKHSDGYFDPRLYFPAWMVEKRGVAYLAQNCPVLHADLNNVTRTDAELKYVRECSALPGAHSLHFYRARRKKTDKVCNIWLAICYSSIEVYEDDAGFKNLISTFLWQDIGRIVFDKRKFEIRSTESAGGRRFAYYTENDGTAKYLLNLCRATHQFQMAIQPKLMEIRHLDAEDKKRYKESYIYSDASDLHANGGPVRHRSGRSLGKSAIGSQRYSAVSDASSNTTSGIVSDRMALSFDEGEETGKEIIIDCPPKQRSLLRAQGHPRMPLRDSYKLTPPTPSGINPPLPPQSLDLIPSPRSSSGKGSPASPPHLQELSPASSTGSYRAKLPHATPAAPYPGKQFALPLAPSPGKTYSRSPSSPRDWEPLPGVVKSGSCQESSFKGVQGGAQPCPEKPNLSGDSSTTSGSSTTTVALSVENSPVTSTVTATAARVPQTSQPPGSAHPGSAHPGSAVGRSTSFSYSPVRVPQMPPSVVLGSSLIHPGKQSSSLPAGCMMYPGGLSRLDVPGTSPPPPPHFLTPSKTLPTTGHIYTDVGSSGVCKVEERKDFPPPLAELGEGARAEEVSGSGGLTVGAVFGHPPPAPVIVAAVTSGISGGSAGKGESVDSGIQASVDGSQSGHHSAQSSEEDPGGKDSQAAEASPGGKSVGAGGKRNTPARVKAGSRSKATHVSVKNQKEALHPDIEQILGQSQAHSLPFIMALCNDLMTASSHSSTGSYDTSTRRSSESQADSRRWSTCGTVETSDSASGLDRHAVSPGTGARPYSWHSEHFELDTGLRPVPVSRAGACLSPPYHQPQPVLENHRSFPQELYAVSNSGHSVLWAQAIANSAEGVPYVGSVDRYSPELIAQQLMIPSRLNSGGHSVSEGGNIGRHKTLKENIGVA